MVHHERDLLVDVADVSARKAFARFALSLAQIEVGVFEHGGRNVGQAHVPDEERERLQLIAIALDGARGHLAG